MTSSFSCLTAPVLGWQSSLGGAVYLPLALKCGSLLGGCVGLVAGVALAGWRQFGASAPPSRRRRAPFWWCALVFGGVTGGVGLFVGAATGLMVGGFAWAFRFLRSQHLLLEKS